MKFIFLFIYTHVHKVCYGNFMLLNREHNYVTLFFRVVWHAFYHVANVSRLLNPEMFLYVCSRRTLQNFLVANITCFTIFWIFSFNLHYMQKFNKSNRLGYIVPMCRLNWVCCGAVCIWLMLSKNKNMCSDRLIKFSIDLNHTRFNSDTSGLEVHNQLSFAARNFCRC